jgi:hypothetical protein
VIACLRRSLQQLIRSERGIALPMALMVTVIAMGFAAVPIVATVNAQNGDSHSQGTNEALAAAEAGAELAVLRQSEALTNSAANNIATCVSPSTLISTGGIENGWCTKFPSATTREKLGNAEFAYQVRPCYTTTAGAGACADVPTSEPCRLSEGKLLVQVVSTGYAVVAGNEITKRVEMAGCAERTADPRVIAIQTEIVTLETRLIQEQNLLVTTETLKTTQTTELEHLRTELSELKTLLEKAKTEPGNFEYEEIPGETYSETVKSPPPNVWGSGGVVGIENLNINNNAQVYNGGAGSNKAVSLSGSANVCGSVRYGTTFTTDNSTSKSSPANCAAGRTATKATATYPAITLPSDIASNNSDYRLCSEAACHAGLDPVPSSVWQRGNMSYNSANKQLTVNYSELTLEGTAPYYLCQLILAGGSYLKAGAGKAIKIYFAPPSSCPGLNGAAQLQIANGTYVYADSAGGPLFLFVGNSSNPAESRVELAGGARSEQFVIYGPYTKVVANNGIEMTGAIVGNTLELGGGASINKYGIFTPPAAETFLPTTETTVTKQKPGTKTSKPGKVIKELEERIVKSEARIVDVEKAISTTETTITHIKSEITTIEQTISTKKITKGTYEEEPGGGAKDLERQSFVECNAGPPIVGEAPDRGC